MVNLLLDQGKLREARTLAEQKTELTRQTGQGSWTQLADQSQRLQILSLLGQHEQVLAELEVLRHRMAELPHERADNDIVNRWNVQETILGVGSDSAVAIGRWEQALDLSNEIITIKQRRGASPYEMARTRFNADRPDAPVLPTTLPEVIRLVGASEGVHFGQLVAALCPDPDTAGHALAELLTTAATLPDQPAENTIKRLLEAWDPFITDIVAAATKSHIPTELTDTLNKIGISTGRTFLITVLHRVMAGDRDRAQLLTGLDDIDTAILTAVLDRLPTSPVQHP